MTNYDELTKEELIKVLNKQESDKINAEKDKKIQEKYGEDLVRSEYYHWTVDSVVKYTKKLNDFLTLIICFNRDTEVIESIEITTGTIWDKGLISKIMQGDFSILNLKQNKTNDDVVNFLQETMIKMMKG